MISGAETLWRDAGLGDLGLRHLALADLGAVAAALLPGEGYTHPGGEPATLSETRQALRGFAENGSDAGFVATRRADDAPVGFLLYRLRNRLAEDFGEGNVLGALSPRLFPADGRFVQVHDLWVDPAWRRRGVARTLKQIAELAAASEGIGMIYTVTEADHSAALALNAGLGYVEIYLGPMWDAVERVALAKYL
ncbi:MAG TPA: GNAT family N-acetyltransferase [Caulobacteraceae bacterium]|jgi:ribosomal protein S18 acetylase RimI-like enzyme